MALALAFPLVLGAQGSPPEPAEALTVADLMQGLRDVAESLDDGAALREEFARLVESHRLAGTDAQFREYVRVRLAFETTRDGGLWGVRWTITDREPDSTEIWHQWARWTPSPDARATPLATPTADAECDEISALSAFVARRLGVKNVGLFWPTSNHTVTVWMPAGRDGKQARVVLPTSQIFLGPDDTLGTTSFDPWTQRTIYPYEATDAAGDLRLPAALVRAFLSTANANAGDPAGSLQARRNRNSQQFGGS